MPWRSRSRARRPPTGRRDSKSTTEDRGETEGLSVRSGFDGRARARPPALAGGPHGFSGSRLRGTSSGVQPRTDADFGDGAIRRGGQRGLRSGLRCTRPPTLRLPPAADAGPRAAPKICSSRRCSTSTARATDSSSGAEVRPWAFAIARRLLVDDIRRGRRVILSDDGDPDSGRIRTSRGPTIVVQAGELAIRIQTILAKLPTFAAGGLRVDQARGLTVAEAAQVLGTTVAAVKLRAHRAYEALRAALGEIDPSLEGGNS